MKLSYFLSLLVFFASVSLYPADIEIPQQLEQELADLPDDSFENDQLVSPVAYPQLSQSEQEDLGIPGENLTQASLNQKDASFMPEPTAVVQASFQNSQLLIDRLKMLLANEYVLQVKTQNFHWNVTGMSFGPLHALFESQYTQIAGFVDAIAERIRALQEFAPGSLAEFKKLATLEEDAGLRLLDKQMLKKLLDGHELIIRTIKNDIELSKTLNDAGTENFLADILVKHEKTSWILKAHLDA